MTSALATARSMLDWDHDAYYHRVLLEAALPRLATCGACSSGDIYWSGRSRPRSRQSVPTRQIGNNVNSARAASLSVQR